MFAVPCVDCPCRLTVATKSSSTQSCLSAYICTCFARRRAQSFQLSWCPWWIVNVCPTIACNNCGRIAVGGVPLGHFQGPTLDPKLRRVPQSDRNNCNARPTFPPLKGDNSVAVSYASSVSLSWGLSQGKCPTRQDLCLLRRGGHVGEHAHRPVRVGSRQHKF